MAVTLLCGFESGETANASNEGGEFFGFLSTPSIQTSIVRSGTYALRTNPTTNQQWVSIARIPAGGVADATVKSFRMALRVASLPTANVVIARCTSSGGVNAQCLWLDTDGKLTLGTGNSTRETTSTNALTADGLWHLIEFDAGWLVGAGKRVFVDGVEWASNVLGTPVAEHVLRIGVQQATATADLYFDDVICDDASISLLSDWKVIWLPVISDNAINTWTGGAGGTSNLFDAVNNVPPVALVAGSDTNTSQILCTTNPGTAYDANVQSYTTAGLTAGDTLIALHALAVHGEGVATGTKTGTVEIVSNPAAATRTFDYGDNAGQATTYPVLWKAAPSVVVASPSVTLGTSPVVRVAKTDTGTREAHVAWLGIYVAYTPGVAAPALATRRTLLNVGI